MFVTVKVSSTCEVGDVVSYNGSEFAIATSLAKPLGVVAEVPIQNGSDWEAVVIFAGIAWAKASRDIPNEGGELAVENGKVYVDNNADGAGIVAPVSNGSASRLANELVMVHVR